MVPPYQAINSVKRGNILAQHTITITGNVISDPVIRTVGENTLFRMRVASSRNIREGEDWKNVDQLYISVECWGKLALNCKASLFRGLPVIVTGTLITHEWEDEKKNKQSRIVLRANHVGIDLIRHQVKPMVVQEIAPPAPLKNDAPQQAPEGDSEADPDQLPTEVVDEGPENATAPDDTEVKEPVAVGADGDAEADPPF